MSWLASFLALLLPKLAPWLITEALAEFHSIENKAVTSDEIDQRLAGVKAAYKAAFDGQPVTADQKTKLNKAISDFINGNTIAGGL